MPAVNFVTPRFTVRLYKSIMRKPMEGGLPTSERYANKEAFIDLTPFLGDGSNITTGKDCRQPAGTFSLTFSDRPNVSGQAMGPVLATAGLETVYGLVEPMDVVEIRMWNGKGIRGSELPIKMRGFVTEITRGRQMGADGRPVRTVVVSGQDYGKIIQMYQILYLPSYTGSEPLLSGFNFFEHFGMSAKNVMTGKEFITTLLEKAINPLLDALIPQYSPMPRVIMPDVQAEGMMNNSYMNQEGSVYDLMKSFLDVGYWNELYVEDREDGVYLVWRPLPYIGLMNKTATQEMAQDPYWATIPDNEIVNVRQGRNDEAISNYYWVTNQRFDMVDDMHRRVEAFMAGAHNETLNYPNTAHKYYGIRALYADSVMGPMDVDNQTSGLDEQGQEARGGAILQWIRDRRQTVIDNNQDNVVFEKGSMDIKGGPARDNGEALKAGDYIQVLDGMMSWSAYVVSITDNFQPYRSYTSSLNFERGTGFAERVSEAAGNSPWLKEQVIRGNTAGNDIGDLAKVDPRLAKIRDLWRSF
ncbi:hypothetical protein EU642_22070 [Salmonella enterica]|nr:hypothetical protein [Salmonella enterica]EAO0118541.1 hypothetical protein [Salmonella enterica]EAO3601646.1 hypothetical protein [Salmonella enterica]EAR6391539.1 hypothetical protein [Salmonella enterica]EAV1285303.1 hypothetical protein [Salmonella enterica]